MNVGFIGLGHMGRAMAVNLGKAGHDVRAWNRTREPQWISHRKACRSSAPQMKPSLVMG